jgi:anti-sigma regulatory factor (Ser/Thr protein kinase)
VPSRYQPAEGRQWVDMVQGDARRPAHAAFLYGSAEEFVTGALEFVDAGLADDEAVLIGLPEPGIGLLRERMNGRAGLVNWADMREVGANPARIISWIRAFAAAHPGRAVRCLQEPAWADRSGPERCEVMRHEALINLAFADVPVSILCPYDTKRLDPGVLGSAEPTHPVLIRDGDAEPSPAYDVSVVLSGECDQPLPGPPAGAAVLEYQADLAVVRAFTGRHARGAGLVPDRTVDLVLAVGELAANTFRYSQAGGVVAIWPAGDELICQVEDAGHITDPLAGRHQVAADAAGGHGLWLVHQVCDLVEIRTGPGRTVIRLHMRLDS